MFNFEDFSYMSNCDCIGPLTKIPYKCIDFCAKIEKINRESSYDFGDSNNKIIALCIVALFILAYLYICIIAFRNWYDKK